jgi:hypothetical protein
LKFSINLYKKSGYQTGFFFLKQLKDNKFSTEWLQAGAIEELIFRIPRFLSSRLSSK